MAVRIREAMAHHGKNHQGIVGCWPPNIGEADGQAEESGEDEDDHGEPGDNLEHGAVIVRGDDSMP